jgi:tripartite-type tricarboxylate transporter receptor subunit TctC
MKRKLMVSLSLAFISCILLSSPTFAAYPDKPIKFIAGVAAGAPLDLMMRTLAKYLSEELNQPITVENRVGGTGAVAMVATLNAPADGYTVVSATSSTSFLIAEGKTSFLQKDFVFFGGLQLEPSAIAVRKDSPYRTLADLIDALKKSPDKVSVGGFATAGFHQFVYYRLQEIAGFKGIWIPFNGGNQAALALLGGHLDATIMTPSSALAQIKSGDIRLLAISTEQRSEYFPNVPTFKEQGIDLVENIWRTIMVKQGTPPDVIARLAQGIKAVEAKPEWKRFMVENGQSPMNISVEKMQGFVADEIQSRRKFLQSILPTQK